MELLLAVTCDDARVRPDGKLDIMGIFNELSAPGFPAAQDRMSVVFVIQWDPGVEGRQPLRADLVDETGREVLTIQGYTDVHARHQGHSPAQTRLVEVLENVTFPRPGRYDFELKAGTAVRRACSIFVRAAPPPDPSTADRV